jgi:hypothetical protein
LFLDFFVCGKVKKHLIKLIPNRTPPTHGLVGCLPWPNLTLHMASHARQNSTNP